MNIMNTSKNEPGFENEILFDSNYPPDFSKIE